MIPGEQVLVLIVRNELQLPEKEWGMLLRQLPVNLRQKTQQFHQWEDRQASLLGKLLLIKGLATFEEDIHLIHTLQWDRYKRPFVIGEIDFNIAHTGGLVVCALLREGRVGIDIERIKPIEIADYKSVFTREEYQWIMTNPYSLSAFFNLWTRKEALMKADGRGFYLDPKTFSALSPNIVIGDQNWQLQALSVMEDYACHLAVSAEKKVICQYLNIEDIIVSNK